MLKTLNFEVITMNNKFIFFFSLLSISLLVTGCFSEPSDIDSLGDVEAQTVDNSVREEVIDVEINTESSDVSRSTSREVVIENMRFNPPDISVSIGDTVEWVNLDNVTHTVSFEDARFDVQVPAGASVSYTFSDEDENPEARYFCKFHPGMQGSILIE